MYGLTKIRAGLYEHRPGALIVRTGGWEGRRGGELECWEHARRGPHGDTEIDTSELYPTLRDAAAAIEWAELVATAIELGFTVELVEYCESADSPGLLGQGLGVCVFDKRIIRIRRALRPADRCFVLGHELDHARGVIAGVDRAHHDQLNHDFHADHEARHRTIAAYLYPREVTPRAPSGAGQ